MSCRVIVPFRLMTDGFVACCVIKIGVDKTRNMEHTGTFRNIPEHSGTSRNIPEHEKNKIFFYEKNN